ncbi:TPA: hypothetical protein ACH3X1_008874 [Trebouxia sp. C0004]
MQAATGISSVADESEVRGAIMSFLYYINEAAKLLGIGVECVGAAVVYGDAVIDEAP